MHDEYGEELPGPERNGTNGTPGPGEVLAVRVYRVEPGTTCFARTLSKEVGGLFTHFVRNRSHYCPGEGCQPLYHRTDIVWKGYAAVELYNIARKKWTPAVLEVTEHMELDLRDIYARGQIWELYRHTQTAKKSTPVMAKLHEEKDPASMPPCFDIVPVLKHLYHVHRIDLTKKNPLPSRVYVTESDDAPPQALEPKKEERFQGSFAEEAARRRQEMAKRKTPTEKKRET